MAAGSAHYDHSKQQHHLSSKDIRLYARDIGIDPEREPELLWLVREAIFARLPPGWAKSQDETGKPIFHNHYLQTSTNEHPCKAQYRQLVAQERERIQRMAAVGGGQLGKKENEEANNIQSGFFCNGFVSVIDSRYEEKSPFTLSFDDEGNSVTSEKEDFGVTVSSSQTEVTRSEMQDSTHSTYQSSELLLQQFPERFLESSNSVLSDSHQGMDVQGEDDRPESSKSHGQLRQKSREEVQFHLLKSTDDVGRLEGERVKGEVDLINFSPELSGEFSYSISSTSFVGMSIKGGESEETEVTKSQYESENESSDEDVLSCSTDQKNCHLQCYNVSAVGAKLSKTELMPAQTTVDKTWSLDSSRGSQKPPFADSIACGFHDSTHFIQIKERKDSEKIVVSKSTEDVGQLGAKLEDQPSKAHTLADYNVCVFHDSQHFIQIIERKDSETTVLSKSTESVGQLVAKLEDLSSKTPTDSAVAIRDGDLAEELTELEAQSQSPETLQQEVSERDSSDSVFETETSSKSQGESGNDSSVEEVYSDIVAQEHILCDSTDGHSEAKHKVKKEEEFTSTTGIFSTSYASGHEFIQCKDFLGVSKVELDKDKKELITTTALLTDFFDSDDSVSDTDSQTETDQDSKSQDESTHSIEGSGSELDKKKAKPIKTPEVLKEPLLGQERIIHDKLSKEHNQKDNLYIEECLVRQTGMRLVSYEEKLSREEEEEARKLLKEKEKSLQLRLEALKKKEEEMQRFERELDKKMILQKKKLCMDADQLTKKKELRTLFSQEELMRMHQHRDRLSKEKEKEMEQLRREEMRIQRQKEIRREQEEALQLMREKETRNQISQGGLMRKKEAEQFNKKMEMKIPLCIEQLRKAQEEEFEHLRVDRKIKNYCQKEELMKEEMDEYLRLKREKETRICRRKVELRREEEEEAQQLKQEKEKRLRLRREELKKGEEEEEEWLKREMYNIKCFLQEELNRARKETERYLKERQIRMQSCLQELRREEEEEAEQMEREKAIRIRKQREALMKEEEDQIAQLKKEIEQRICHCFEKLRREEAEEAEQLRHNKEMRIQNHLNELQREEEEEANILRKDKHARCILCQEQHTREKEEQEEEFQKYIESCKRQLEEELRREEEEVENIKREKAMRKQLRQQEERKTLEKEKEKLERERRLQMQQEELRREEVNEQLMRKEELRKSLLIDELNREAEEVAWLKRSKEVRIRLYEEGLRREEEDEIESLKKEQMARMSLHQEALRREEENEMEQLQRDRQKRMHVCREQLRREGNELEKLRREKIKTEQNLLKGLREEEIEQLKRENAMEKNLQGVSNEGKETARLQGERKRERKTSLLCQESSTEEKDGLFLREKKKTILYEEELKSEDEEHWLKEEIRMLLRKMEKDHKEKMENKRMSWLCQECSTEEESEGLESEEKSTPKEKNLKSREKEVEHLTKIETPLQLELRKSKDEEKVYVSKGQKQKRRSVCIEELKSDEMVKVEQLQREKKIRMHKYEEELKREEEIEAGNLKRAKEQRIRALQEELMVEEMEQSEQLKREQQMRIGPRSTELQKDEGQQLKWENEELKREEDEEAEQLEIEKESRMSCLQDELKRGTEELIDKFKAEKQKRMRLRQIDLWGEEEERKLKAEYKYRLRALRQCLLAKRRDEEILFNKLFQQENLTDSVRVERKDERYNLRQDREAALRALCHALEEEREAKRDRFKAQRRQFLQQLKAESKEDLHALRTRLQECAGENLNFMTPEAQEKTLDSVFFSTFHLSTGAAPEPQIEKLGGFRLTPERTHSTHFTTLTPSPIASPSMTTNLATHPALSTPESLFCHPRAAVPVDPFTTTPLRETYLASPPPGFCNQLSLNKFNEITVYRFRRQNPPCEHILTIQ
ncbi:trichohyalin-like [Corythoichthys intestinalis]|uniref:trichohyalin-like n=1 Tax=Corythoichthys intestinalis TaxID=161448 RepID=UPI0025A5B100|nr:trichohyalin-like [Corythoichthys intestinalis]